jgi:hypothetical protein
MAEQTQPQPVISGPKSLPLGAKPYSAPYNSIGKEICQNLMVEYSSTDTAKAQYYYISTPGLKLQSYDSVNNGACRALYTTAEHKTYTVVGNGFYEVAQNGIKALKGTLTTNVGPVSMTENGYQMILVDGRAGWIFDYVTQDFTRITDEYFPGNSEGTDAPTHVTYIDTYFIVNVPNKNEYQWSNSYYKNDNGDDYKPSVVNGYWNAIQMGQKMGRPDIVNALIDCTNMLWLFGTNSIEIHYDTGNYNGQLFARYEGAILEVGTSAPKSVARYANSVFWLGSDKSGTIGVFTNEGMSPKRISTRCIEQIIEGFDTTTDCIGFTYAQAGHSYYVMQFPGAKKTLVYDSVTQAWHERTYLNSNTGALEMWRGIYSTSNWDKIIVGNPNHSSLFELDLNYFQNDDEDGNGVNYIKRVKTTPIEFNNGQLLRFNTFQVMFQQGVGLNDNTAEQIGKNPECLIAFSNDSGSTYSGERVAYIGAQGQYAYRSRITTIGIGRNRVWRITITDPIRVIIVGILVDVVPMTR